jgi:hypothetical protein
MPYGAKSWIGGFTGSNTNMEGHDDDGQAPRRSVRGNLKSPEPVIFEQDLVDRDGSHSGAQGAASQWVATFL